jgi:penicillin-insensitive murein endopeptidase
VRRAPLLCCLLLFSTSARAQDGGVAFPFAQAKTPASGDAESIGGYSAGCVRGARALPLKGRGFEIMRPERNRLFGHPALIGFLTELASRVAARHIGLLRVGDLGQPRGGPAPTGHASHQTGLDVDVWYALDAARITQPSPVVDLARRRLTSAWSPKIAQVLKAAVADPRVERIFVNPLIKRALCAGAGATPEERAWLHKVRPWWGHHEHFHVRLACPPGSPDCEAQPPLPPGDGCGELGWWLDPKSEGERKKQHGDYQARVGAAPALPERCRDVLEAE